MNKSITPEWLDVILTTIAIGLLWSVGFFLVASSPTLLHWFTSIG